MENKIDIQIAIQNLEKQLNKASSQYHEWAISGEDWFEPSWIIESNFIQLLSVVELLELFELRKMVHEDFLRIKSSKHGLSEGGTDPDGDPYSTVIKRVRCYLIALKNLFEDDNRSTVTKDLLQIIRDIHYVITDTSVFQKAPENENDVHIRIEAVLKCVFPDLKHKPVLTKQIKNFEPDTGIKSLQTVIEYKYLSKKTDIAPIADQLLADTRGYTSKDWSRFLYVIYETNRFRTEKDWNIFLQESGVAPNTSIVVLSGEPSGKKAATKKRTPKKKAQPGA